MKKIYLLILAIVFILIAGCTSQMQQSPQRPTSIETTQMVTVTSVLPTLTPQLNTPQPTPITTQTLQTVYSTTDINKHFIDIAFSQDNNVIQKWNTPLLSVAITGTYTKDDLANLNDFFKQFNIHSSYVKLPSQVKEGQQANIVLNLLPESGLNNLNPDTSWKPIHNPISGKIIGYYKTMTYLATSTNFVYLDGSLKGDERKHWILHSVLYDLGFMGETGQYPDSIFYTNGNTVPSPNSIDWKAIELMYGSKISNGMSLSDIKNILFIETSTVS